METNNENLDMIYDIVRKAGMREGDELSIATDARVSLPPLNIVLEITKYVHISVE